MRFTMKSSLVALVFFLCCSLISVITQAMELEEAPLEPPYTRGPNQEAPLEAPYTSAPPQAKAGVQDLSKRTIPKPTSIDEDSGDYYYEKEHQASAIYYDFDHVPPITGSVFVRFGMMGPYEIKSDDGAATYESLYTDKPSLSLYAEYEWMLGAILGKWYLKLGSGITSSDGNGRFVNGAAITPKEKFTFLMFPTTAMLNYKLRFSDTQWVTPYVEAGGGYMGFIEFRNDGDKTVFGGAPFTAFAGGLLINMSIIDKHSSHILYEDYGIHQIWFDMQFRRNVGLDDKKDFSSNMITAGFGFAF